MSPVASLTPTMVGRCGEAGKGLVGDVAACAAGHVVDQDRQVARRRQGRVVLVETLLARTVVVGCDHQRGVGAGCLGVTNKADPFRRGVRPGAGDHRDATGDDLDAERDDPSMLGVRQRRGLAGGADRNHAVHAARDLTLDQGGERRLIDRAAAKRGDQRRNDAAETGHVSRSSARGRANVRDPPVRAGPTVANPDHRAKAAKAATF